LGTNSVGLLLNYLVRPQQQRLRNRQPKGLGDGIDGYSRAAFLEDLIREAEQDIRRCPQRRR